MIRADEVRERAERLKARLSHCDLCPQRCGVDRLSGEVGFCGVGYNVPVSSVLPHHGEEPALSGYAGAGTIFFAGCNMRCCYCQNYQISRRLEPAHEMSPEELADAMLRLQDRGCHNVEFVTPSHVVAQILEAIAIAVERGLELPIVYNSGGYDSLDILQELEGVVDVYLPDLKYSDEGVARRLSHAKGYWGVATASIREMVRQVGALETDAEGVAVRGVIVRHLVLPNGLSGSEKVLRFLATLNPRPAVSLMAQYYPVGVCSDPLLGRTITPSEYEPVRRLLEDLDLTDGWVQELSSHAVFRPDFAREEPFEQETP